MRTLNVIETAYRATLEEHDDPVIWIVHALHDAGAELAVLLRGSAVTCASPDQDAAGLEFGGIDAGSPPDLAGDVARLLASGVEVFYVEDDLDLRGLAANDLLPGLKPVGCGDLPELFQQFDRVWHW